MHEDQAKTPHGTQDDGGFADVVQSLIIAFVLAMTFRGFVVEGFVIPTGSMAPTLLGQHFRVHSELTGHEFAVGVDRLETQMLLDPMLGPNFREPTGLNIHPSPPQTRGGDRILVLKTIYPFAEPNRFDVVVFKNPTEPKGDSGNYIKRLVGLPNETIWIADGDVFVKPAGESDFSIRRKPEYIQRALWSPIFDSNAKVRNPALMQRSYPGPPWRGENWQTDSRIFRTDRTEATMLEWNLSRRRLDDFTAYNMLHSGQPGLSSNSAPLVNVSDLRIAAGIHPDQTGLTTALELETRSHIFEFKLNGREAILRYRQDQPDSPWIEEVREPIESLDPDRVTNVEFWHVDQSMQIFIAGRSVARLDYEWTAEDRLRNATGYDDLADAADAGVRGLVQPTELRWHFDGSPVSLHRVRVDRDLYYRGGRIGAQPDENPTARPEYARMVARGAYAYGTHPDNLAELGPDQFYMLGDNSQFSLDSRLWKNPHPTVAAQIDDAPFVVHRDLLLGKAWVVYFPAVHTIGDGERAVIPDFGRLRYIR
ncbi:MAG: hypothetical protein EA377_06580 [Phycisphaerales bacterium]|nr:MAG: hypothetical protein EA377_06580 [Phycisphaerales bacterium]